MPTPGVLLELPEPEPVYGPEPKPVPRLKRPERNQLVFGTVDLEKLIPEDHLARAVWDLAQKLPEEGFLRENKSVEGHAGRPRLAPRMLVSIWVYGYSQGIGLAETIAEHMKYEPGLRWLSGDGTVSGRTLGDFRTEHGQALRDMFQALLAMLEEAGLIDLEQVTLDGTKVKASASASSFRREKTLRERMEQASEVVRQLSEKGEAEEISRRHTAARKRAAEERDTRLKKALEELEAIRANKKNDEEREQARVSLTDPESRVMKDGKGGFAPSYNVQLVTDTKNKVIVGVGITQRANDQDELRAALDKLAEQGRLPKQVMVDGGYTTANNIALADERKIELIGPPLERGQRQVKNLAQSLNTAGIAPEFAPSAFRILEDRGVLECPAGKQLHRRTDSAKYAQYWADASDCAACEHRPQCCPKSGRRTVKIQKTDARVIEFDRKMRQPDQQEIYARRGEVAEFPHAWIKDKLGLRQFHVRGLPKVEIEAYWVALTYNMQQWVRLVWRPKLVAA